MALGRVVEQCRAEQVGIALAGPDELLHHVEGVAAIRNRHGCEELVLGRGQQLCGERLLDRLDACSDVRDELADAAMRGHNPRRSWVSRLAIANIQPSGLMGLFT